MTIYPGTPLPVFCSLARNRPLLLATCCQRRILRALLIVNLTGGEIRGKAKHIRYQIFFSSMNQRLYSTIYSSYIQCQCTVIVAILQHHISCHKCAKPILTGMSDQMSSSTLLQRVPHYTPTIENRLPNVSQECPFPNPQMGCAATKGVDTRQGISGLGPD